MKKKIAFLSPAFFLLAVLITPQWLLAGPYYEGKVVTIVVGSTPGGGYDLMGRLFAKHIHKHIPGKPSIIVDNMAGGDGIVAANYLFHVAKPDGLTIACLNRALVFAQLLKVEGIRFDMTKFSWICASGVESVLICIRGDLPYKSIYDLQKAEKTIFLGGQGPPAVGTQFIKIATAFLRLNVKIVDYRGMSDTILALERKEVDGTAIAYNSRQNYIERGLLRPLLRTKVANKGVENLPAAEELINDKLGKNVMSLFGSISGVGKPFLAPPGVPTDMLKILRDAFAKALRDPELQADAKKMGLELEYVPPEDCLKVMNYILNQPPDIINEFSKYVKF